MLSFPELENLIGSEVQGFLNNKTLLFYVIGFMKVVQEKIGKSIFFIFHIY